MDFVMLLITSFLLVFLPSSVENSGRYIIGTAGQTGCPTGYELVRDQDACYGRVRQAMSRNVGGIAQCHNFAAVGCFVNINNNDDVWFSTCTSSTRSNHAPICEDVDECRNHTDNCHSKAICKNTLGSFTCECKKGWIGNGQTCTVFDPLKHAPFNLECEQDHLTATWLTGVFGANHPLNISLLDPQCDSYTENGTHAWIQTNYTECGTTISEEDDKIVHENVASVTSTYLNNFVRKVHTYNYNLSCIFDRRFKIMTANSFLATDREVFVARKNDTSSFSVELHMYETGSYLTAYTEDPVRVAAFEPMFFGIKANNNNNKVKFVVEQCYAVPSTGSQDIKYVFYAMKCALDPTFKIDNYTDNRFNFEIEAFNFVKVTKSVRIHCLLLACKADSELQECMQECDESRRKRRKAGDDVSTLEAIDIETTFDIVYEKKVTCTDISCPANSICLELYPAVCRCNTGYVMHRTSGRCTAERHVSVTGLHIDMTYLPTYDDPTTEDYLRLVTTLGNELLTTLQLDNPIEGLKVTSVRKGSVIADITLLHSPDVTKFEAAKVFVNVTSEYALHPTGTLRFVPDTAPTLVLDEDEGEEIADEMTGILIGVVVAVVAVALLIVAGLLYRKHHAGISAKGDEQPKGVDNRGVELS